MTKDTNLHSLRNLTDFFGDNGRLSVVVPKIQRAYAQGRSKELSLRTRATASKLQLIDNQLRLFGHAVQMCRNVYLIINTLTFQKILMRLPWLAYAIR